MIPNLAVLQKKCDKLGLVVTPKGKKLSKQDCISALREAHLPEGGLPYEEIEPMLCFAEWNLKPSEQRDVWNSDQWVAQRKINGARAMVHFVKGVGVFIHTRNVSVQTWRYDEISAQFLFHQFVPDFDATIDCEALIDKPVDTRAYTAKGAVTKSSLHSTTSAIALRPENSRKMQVDQDAPMKLWAFDIVKFQGRDLRKLSLRDRLVRLGLFRAMIEAHPVLRDFFVFPEVVQHDRKAYCQRLYSEGAEGVILKNLNSPYVDSSSRRRNGWVKVKRSLEFDAFVSGFKRGEAGTGWENLVGALEFSVHTDEGDHVLGYVSSLPLQLRQKLTIYDAATDTVSLHPKAYGKVGEITGQDVSARSLRLSHCTLNRWRDKAGDKKDASQCRVKMADLRAAAAWAE